MLDFLLLPILNLSEKLKPLGKVIYSHLSENLPSKEKGSRYTYAVIRDQLEHCQHGGDNSPCSSYCNVPESTHYHGKNTFTPQTTSKIANFLKENNIHVAAHVGAEGYHRLPTPFSWNQGLKELKPQTAQFIVNYYREILNQEIDPPKLMNGTELSIVKDAILKDKQFIVHRPTNGVELMALGEYGRRLIPLISKFVDHLIYSYHFPWQPDSSQFIKQNQRLNKYLDLIDFSSDYTTTKFLRVVTRDREPTHTLALCDRVLQLGSVLFDFTIHDGKGVFSTNNKEAIPTVEQLEKLHLGLLARLLFMDQMIETNLDYLLMTPAFGSHYINCGGSEKAVFVVRAEEDGTPVQDTCSEVPTGMSFPTPLNEPLWIQAQDQAAQNCGNCRQMCESPFRWNRDLRNESQRPLTTITTLKQIGKAIRVQAFGNKNPVRYTPYKREQLQDQDFIQRLLKARSIMVADRFSMPYWQKIAYESGLSEIEIANIIERYNQEQYDKSFINECQLLEQQIASITNGPYPDEEYWYNKAAHKISKLWGGGFALEKPLILTTRDKMITYAPSRLAKRLSITLWP